jgi:hypothetical protein
MAGYDPQARRARPTPPAASPVDGLLDVVDPVEAPADGLGDRSVGAPVIDLVVEAPIEDSSEAPADTGERLADEGLLPFETPPVEMTDERADLLHRVGVLAAVAALVLVLVAVRRRRRDV